MKVKLFLLTLMLVLLLPLSLAYSGIGHSHNNNFINGDQAIISASDNVSSIVKQQIDIEGSKLDSSWNNIPISNKAISKKGYGYYIVSLNNKGQDKI
jgi:hypothetical protein